MLQAWILRGIEMASPASKYTDGQIELGRLFVEAGYSSVVATNCEQEYLRYLRPGDRVVAETIFEAISDEKATALGIGYFIDTRTTFRDQNGDEVGWMKFRILRFRPNLSNSQENAPSPAPAGKPRRLRPPLGHDNKWWWDGIAAGELRIQRCKSCQTLRHPPRPMCGKCQSIEWDWAISKGAGTVYSFVVMHYPADPRLRLPTAGSADRPRRGHAPRRQRGRLQAVRAARRHARAGEDRSRRRRDETPVLLPR